MECQQVFEEWCKHAEEESVTHTCPICKGKTKRLISDTSFALKGDGWYVTDYGTHKGIKDDGAPAAADKCACAPATADKCTDGAGVSAAAAKGSASPAGVVEKNGGKPAASGASAAS
jgi:putative FmdB family regulatory protein